MTDSFTTTQMRRDLLPPRREGLSAAGVFEKAARPQGRSALAAAGKSLESPAVNPQRFPCSPIQRRFWVLDRMEPGYPALNIATRWRLDGRVATSDLTQAFAQIIERHQPLRTHFTEEDGEPAQIVEPFLPFHIPEIDLTGLADEDAFAEAERIAQLEARTSFVLSVPPLIRVTHLRVRDNVSIVLLTTHHMVCDSGSIDVLAREMGTICAALHAGQTAEMTTLPVSDGEDPAGQALRLSADALRNDEKFWTQSLEGLEHFELYPDHARPPVQTSHGKRVSLLLDRELTQGMLDLSRRSSCSLLATALAALFTLLHRYSGESDIAIGSQVTGRDTAALENAVGLFTNHLVLRGDLSGDPEFAGLLARVRDMLAGSLEHQSTSLGRLIEILKPKRDLSRNALFSVNFIFKDSFIPHGDYGSFRLMDLPPCCPGAMCDLTFLMVQWPEGWRLSCEYNTDLFDPETPARLLNHLANLLRSVAVNPAQRLSAIPILDVAERRTLAVDWNQSDADYPKHLALPQLFENQARQTPDAVAVVCGEQSLSYRELDIASNRLAHELRSRGIGRARLVGVCLDRTPDLVVALLAVLKSGAAYIPLDPAYPVVRLAQIIEDARPAAVLTKLALRERLPASEAAIILLDTEAASIGQQSDTPLDSTAAPTPGDLAYVIFTSGSTGRPKGVQIQHQALTNLLWSMRSQPGLTADDTLVSVTTVSFDIAALELFLPLIVGAKLVVAQETETADGAALLRLLRQHRATVMQATPVTWQILLAAGWSATAKDGASAAVAPAFIGSAKVPGRSPGDRGRMPEPPDPKLKMLCGGEAMTRALADQLLLSGGELWNVYGPTETTIWSSALRVEPGSGPVPIGPPTANTQFYVLDPHGQLMPMGAPGELFIGGDGVALGYLNLSDMTRERFVPDTFRKSPGARLYRTGDLVRMRKRGRLEFLGRSDHQIKLRGFRIELGEIETALRAHPQVSDCVAVAATDASGEVSIRAYAVARDAVPQLAASLRERLRQTLPAYMCPSFIIVLAALPRTPNGKIDRASLPVPVLEQENAQTPGLPLSEHERRLVQIWTAVLGNPAKGSAIGVNANFFEVGGHSLLAVRLLARIETGFGRKLSLAALFKNPTIAEQAKLLALEEREADRQAFDFRQVVQLQANGARPPLIAINNTGIYYVLSKRLGPDQPFTSLQLFDPALPQALLPQSLEDIATGYAELIRRVQPTGPYALLGWCVAGTLAFEVARQLTASGQKVAQLFLFDTLAPGYLKRLPRVKALLADYSYRWKLIAADWTRFHLDQNSMAAFRTFLTNRATVKKLMGWVRKLVPASSEPIAENQLLSLLQYDQWLLKYLEDAAEAYEPKPYPGTMTLFRSSEEPAGRFLDPQMGWGEFVRGGAEGGIEVVVIPGNHFSIFQEPSVSRMAQHIESAVDARLLRIAP